MTHVKAISILLVDDNPDHVELTLNGLKCDGLINKINVACDGEEALDYLYNRGKFKDRKKYPKPELILLDIKLPKIDGMEVLHIIKKDPLFKSIPVIILTTSDNQKDVEAAYYEGANSFISKPVSFKEFVEKLCEIKLYWAVTNVLPGDEE